MQIRLWTQLWKFLFVPKLVSDKGVALVGECDPNTNTIRVISSLRGQFKLDTCIHEILHAACPEKDELWVNSVGSDMAQVLWEIGYRNVREEKPPKQGKNAPKS